MLCRVMYRHPVTRNWYYFQKLQYHRPVGCMLHRARFAPVFDDLDALPIVDYLRSLSMAVKVVGLPNADVRVTKLSVSLRFRNS